MTIQPSENHLIVDEATWRRRPAYTGWPFTGVTLNRWPITLDEHRWLAEQVTPRLAPGATVTGPRSAVPSLGDMRAHRGPERAPGGHPGQDGRKPRRSPHTPRPQLPNQENRTMTDETTTDLTPEQHRRAIALRIAHGMEAHTAVGELADLAEFILHGIHPGSGTVALDPLDTVTMHPGHTGLSVVNVEPDEPERPEWTQALVDVEVERERQQAIGYDADHDDEHTMGQWANLATDYLGHAVQASETREARRRLVQATAILVAAIESIDRGAHG